MEIESVARLTFLKKACERSGSGKSGERERSGKREAAERERRGERVSQK